MNNYGIRISIPGKDVKTCSDLDTTVNSKYSLLKGAIYGSGTIDNNGNEITTTTIAHNLGYIPFIQVYMKFSDESFWGESPILDSGVAFISCRHYFNDTNLIIKTEQAGEIARTFSYKYFIYLDKGKI